MDEPCAETTRGPLVGVIDFLGSRALTMLETTGAAWYLLVEAVRWLWRGLTEKKVRVGRPAIVSQVVRVGVRSVFIISLVSSCVGLILALQMAPPLDKFGSKELVANITGVAIFRELGPLIAAIVLTGFAGAAIAAEIGTMVVGEEIEALEAHALNPVRFLVVPRVLASVLSMTCLAVLSDVVAVVAGWAVGVTALGIPSERYIQGMRDQVKLVDFLTGIGKGTVFGLLIGLIACNNGLRVTGGAAGVGAATTNTVVQSIVSIVIADLAFTAIFYAVGWV
jgi:phospholipid/cholesterol/gamma-HCH transport system permease protein